MSGQQKCYTFYLFRLHLAHGLKGKNYFISRLSLFNNIFGYMVYFLYSKLNKSTYKIDVKLNFIFLCDQTGVFLAFVLAASKDLHFCLFREILDLPRSALGV